MARAGSGFVRALRRRGDEAPPRLHSEPMEERSILAHLDRSDGFPRPDWDTISALIKRETPEPERGAAFTQAAEEWLLEMAATLGGDYEVLRSPNFLLLSSLPRKTGTRLIAFLERTRELILSRELPGIAAASGYGSHVAILFADIDSYYSYIAYHFPEQGEFAANGGVLLSGRHGHTGSYYTHFVSYGAHLGRLEPVVAHELTHNCLRHLPIPGWLNEGLAKTVESALTCGPLLTMRSEPRLTMRPEDLDDHRAVWSDGGIQTFWSGAAVHSPSEASRLTYHLASVLVKALSHDYERFRKFVLAANRADAGEAAARSVYGRSLGELVGHILGPGDWAPRPETWNSGAK
jgi:hypothetical protein